MKNVIIGFIAGVVTTWLIAVIIINIVGAVYPI